MANTLQYHEIYLPLGRIRGVIRKTIYDDSYYSFEGIPYGQPPLGELRFKAPLPTKPWPGVRECLEFKVKPVQKSDVVGEAEGCEDCLYLSVFAKKLKSEKPLPVLVWVYGGGFNTGEATTNYYSPDYFMSEDIIVVTFNYRVGALGFLSVKDPTLQIPGNAGLKDQILALKWVKQFIRYFNGDSGNITLAGNSAGSACVHYLTAAEPTEGLFHKAICMSGTVLNPWALVPPKNYAYRLAQKHGFKGEDIDTKVVEFLRSLSAKHFGNCDVLDEEDTRNNVMFSFGPCIEPYYTEDCVIPREPREMIRNAWGNDIPVIFSGTSEEGLLMYRYIKNFSQVLKEFNQNPEMLLPYELRSVYDSSKNVEMGKKLFSLHFGDNSTNDKAASTKCIIDYYSINIFWHGIHRAILSRLEHSKAPTYLYRFSFDSPTFNHMRRKFCGDNVKSGASHADDISYLWHGINSWKLDKSSIEYKTIRKMVGIFVQFAKTATVDIQRIAPDDKGCYPLMWQPLDSNDPNKALNIDKVLELKTIPEKQAILVWDSLYREVKLF